jgi:hypothetical protein
VDCEEEFDGEVLRCECMMGSVLLDAFVLELGIGKVAYIHIARTFGIWLAGLDR